MNLYGISSRNRPEWYMMDYVSQLYNFTIVPMYDTLGPDSTTYILEDTNLDTIFTSSETIGNILNTPNLVKVKTIVCFDPITDEKYRKIAE